MNKEVFNFILPARAEYLTIVRLTSSAIASRLDFDIEKIEDLKLCVSEVCNIGIKSEENQNFNIQFTLGEKDIEIEFLDFIINPEVENIEMSKMILQALIEDIEITDDYVKLKLYV